MTILTDLDLKVLRLYQESHRRYHTAFHIIEMLELHATGSTRGVTIPGYRKPEWGSLREADFVSAVVAHDCVYEVGHETGFNEKTSFETWKAMGGYDDTGVIEAMILATITHEPGPAASQLRALDLEMVCHLIDLDMSVLGATRAEFDVNSANIKAEFLAGGIDPNAYDAGRRGFFAKTLAQPRIFFTPQFHRALEQRARMNMIEDLGPSWPIPDEWRTGKV
jgi:predicted metal-dependent HD superfamily phosphohydrolase